MNHYDGNTVGIRRDPEDGGHAMTVRKLLPTENVCDRFVGGDGKTQYADVCVTCGGHLSEHDTRERHDEEA